MQYLKGKSSYKLLSDCSELGKRCWGQHLWARGYWVAPGGNVADEVGKEYIKNQTPPEPEATGFESWSIHANFSSVFVTRVLWSLRDCVFYGSGLPPENIDGVVFHYAEVFDPSVCAETVVCPLLLCPLLLVPCYYVPCYYINALPSLKIHVLQPRPI